MDSALKHSGCSRQQADLAKLEADRKWRHLSVSTDFDANT
jgi:hypothetical protein